jgi:hypothetical protein
MTQAIEQRAATSETTLFRLYKVVMVGILLVGMVFDILVYFVLLVAPLLHAAMDTMFIAVSPLAETDIFLTAWSLVAGLTMLVALALVLRTGVDLGHKRGL